MRCLRKQISFSVSQDVSITFHITGRTQPKFDKSDQYVKSSWPKDVHTLIQENARFVARQNGEDNELQYLNHERCAGTVRQGKNFDFS